MRSCLILAHVLFVVSVVQSQTNSNTNAAPTDALSVIENYRGGRHWVDEETAPPMSPEKSLAALQIESGVEITQLSPIDR